MTVPATTPEATLAEQEMFSLANDLRLACQRIARRVRFESTSEVAPHQFSVLTFLQKAGPQTPTQLAAHDRVSAPSMTRTINCMVDEGLVERVPHPDDRRQILVTPTERGNQIIAETIASRDTWMLAHLDGLGDEQLGLLRKATDILLEVSNA
ncbi:MarR family winged helix-turn-helix transcriptional regulator [Tessaracoccus palaemonis]|uniref:MarR family transcriptional regulator n=1 Tax=Tessaracoccus palaemonis TaxID=2829499 RepID=A0ABX8SI51_9ACTN|nr:MarR family transcriptional regulator [Tessaracoccus palaemonis]QXT63066.1 MarR family transcriptional regulator [Tessaracoccus palaemonis]